jgi:hypothetical protein
MNIAEDFDDVLINSDFGLSSAMATDISTLLAMRSNKEISHEAFITEIKRRGILSIDYDIDADAQLMKDEVVSPSETDAGASAGDGLPPKKTIPFTNPLPGANTGAAVKGTTP